MNLSSLILDCIDIYSVAFEDAGGQIIFEKPSEAIFFTGDRARMERALANLLDNSLNYSDKPKITIELWQTHNVYMRIKDNGPGVPDSIREKVFERFVRGDESRKSQGSGLGLSIVRSYIQLQEGSIELEGSEEGASFIITLPNKKAEETNTG